ncbi:MAG: AAA family ATPase [Gemmataceae bacterium]
MTTELPRLQTMALESAPPAPWLWRGLLAPHTLTLMHGTPRVGKTTMTAALLASSRQGGDLAGLPVRKARALVLTQDSAEQWRQSVPGFRLDKHVCYLCRPPRGGAADEGQALLEHVRDLTQVFAFDLVVLDPFSAFMPARPASLARLRTLADTGVAVLLVHDEPGDRTSLLTLTAAADIVVELTATANTRQRRLSIGSRFADSPHSLVLELNPAGKAYRCIIEEEKPPARAARSPHTRRGVG